MRARPHPTDPQQCYFDKMSLLLFADPTINRDSKAIIGPGRTAQQSATKLAEDYRRPERDAFDHQAIINGEKTITIDQDIELLGGVQAGMASQGFNTVWLNDDEMRVQHFHNELDHLLE